MSIKLGATHLELLGAASRREDRCLTPPKGAKLAQARKSAARLLEAGLVREVKAKKGVPVWRRDEEAGRDYALALTAARLKAVTAAAGATDRLGAAQSPNGKAPESATAPDAEPELATNHAAVSSRFPEAPRGAVSPRAGTKVAAVIALLGRAEGATIGELVETTGWLPHTTRAALTGLRKRGFALSADRTDRAHGSIYRIAAAAESRRSKDQAAVESSTVTAGDRHAEAASVPRAQRRPPTPAASPAGSYEAP